jgi:hypothetical protein
MTLRTFGQPMEHVLRQCLIALKLAERAGLEHQRRPAAGHLAEDRGQLHRARQRQDRRQQSRRCEPVQPHDGSHGRSTAMDHFEGTVTARVAAPAPVVFDLITDHWAPRSSAGGDTDPDQASDHGQPIS